MLTSTPAIVLRATRYGDSRLICDVLTRSFGRLSVACAAGATSAAGRRRRQLLQPMSQVELAVDMRPQARVQRLTEVRRLYAYAMLTADARKLAIALFLAEVLAGITRCETEGGRMFDYVQKSLAWLDCCPAERGFANFHLAFLMRLAPFLGIRPDTRGYRTGDSFDMAAACYTAAPRTRTEAVPPADAARINTLVRMNYANMHLFRMTRDERNRCTDYILRYYRQHIPDLPEPRSLAVVQQLFV